VDEQKAIARLTAPWPRLWRGLESLAVARPVGLTISAMRRRAKGEGASSRSASGEEKPAKLALAQTKSKLKSESEKRA